MSSYRAVLATRGAIGFSSAALVGRMPISMTGLGLVLLISERTGEYGLAGTVSAVHVLSTAAFGPLQGRLADRIGQAWLLRGLSSVFAAALVVAVLLIEAGAAAGWLMLSAAVAGMAVPQTGSMVRARWSHAVKDRRLLATAFAIEAILDEVVFVVGPVLVTYLTLNIVEQSGLSAAAALCVTGSWFLSVQRRTEPPAVKHVSGTRPPIPWRLLGPITFTAIGIGILFGSAEILIVAFASDHDQRQWAGTILAIWASGSLLAGIIVGIRPARNNLKRMRTTLLILSLAFLPLTFAPNMLWLAGGMFLAGFMISPTLISAMSLVQHHVPSARLTEAMAWVTTGLAVGVAPGAAIAGWIVDNYNADKGFLFPLCAGLIASVVASFTRTQ